MNSWRIVCVAWLVAGLAATASAHDLWLVPRAVKDGVGVVELNSGMDFPKSESAPRVASFAETFVVTPSGERAEFKLGDAEGNSRLAQFDAKGDGVYIAAARTTPKVLKLAAEDFNESLVTDGLAHIYRQRAKDKTLDQPGVERYSKSPKVLIRVGDKASAVDDKVSTAGGDPCRALGLPLEIVPLADPFAVKPGDTLAVRVLFQDKPLAEATVGWQSPGDGEQPRGVVRTDAKGEALVPINRAGLMTLRLTHMTQPKSAEYEWESFWTSLTWEVGR
jgi:uncharacterized GH25 family protein